MKSWIFSVCAIVMITTIISFILPEGKMGKYIKGIFSLFIVFIIIKPLSYIKENDFDYTAIINQESVDLQYDFIEYISLKKIEEYKEICLDILINNGIQKGDIEINYLLDDLSNIKIEEVKVNLQKAVIILHFKNHAIDTSDKKMYNMVQV